ncbi:MAG: hypothetical protein LBE84_00165, partial [Planctomycetota bacterium]|nr:hypothetical protein [Planctomycetota bacterium]
LQTEAEEKLDPTSVALLGCGWPLLKRAERQGRAFSGTTILQAVSQIRPDILDPTSSKQLTLF